jgi:hypothetical protein
MDTCVSTLSHVANLVHLLHCRGYCIYLNEEELTFSSDLNMNRLISVTYT